MQAKGARCRPEFWTPRANDLVARLSVEPVEL